MACTSCGCVTNNCGCQTAELCGTVSPGCTPNDPCAQAQADCEAADQLDCCTICNLFVTTTQPFNMPDCADCTPTPCTNVASIFVDDASRLFPGAILWAEGVGYLKVIEVLDASEVSVINECPECAGHVLNPGQPVAEGTQFGVGIPVCVDGDCGDPETLGPQLNSDFFVPAVSACTLIAVTNTNGLAIGDTVSIASGRYRINDIPTTTTIEICNEGEGGTAGTLIEKDPNGDGCLDYRILRISSQSPCLADSVECGKLLVCSAGNTQTTLVGTIEGQIPVWNNTDKCYENKVSSNLATCVTMECCLNLDPEAATCDSYLIDVSPDTDDFQAALDDVSPNPLKITIDGDPFCVTEVIDADTLRVIPSFNVYEVTQYADGAVVCIDECCKQCNPTILTMDNITGDNGCEPEVLVGTGRITLTAVPGVSTITLPNSIGEGGLEGHEAAAESLWQLDVTNDDCCDCRKYIEVTSNYEVSHFNSDAALFTNVELRILKSLPIFDSQAFAGMPFVSPRDEIIALPPDLIIGNQTINTYKGTVYDRGFIAPGENIQYKGHVRIVMENTSGAPIDFELIVQWRVWVKIWDFGCADVAVTLPP